jgi:hypothetical protein
MIPFLLSVLKWMKEEMEWLFSGLWSDNSVPTLAPPWAAEQVISYHTKLASLS